MSNFDNERLFLLTKKKLIRYCICIKPSQDHPHFHYVARMYKFAPSERWPDTINVQCHDPFNGETRGHGARVSAIGIPFEEFKERFREVYDRRKKDNDCKRQRLDTGEVLDIQESTGKRT